MTVKNYTDWTISSQALVKWRRFTDYPFDGEYNNFEELLETVDTFIKSCILPIVLIYLNMNNKTIQIYTLSHPLTGEIRYIGKTVSPLKYRLAGHVSESKKGELKSHRNSWIRSLLQQDLKPNIHLLDEISSNDWEWLEQYWISQFKTWGFNLINMTDGGDGNKNQVWTEESKRRFKETIRKKIKSGEIDYTERAIKISKALTGKKRSLKTREKVRQANIGKTYSRSIIYKRTNGGVNQFTKDGILIGSYFSLTEASQKTGFFRGNISSACTGRLKTYKGFIWRYKGKDIVDAKAEMLG